MNPNRGGVQRVSDILAKYFISKGHKIFYLTYEYDERDNYNFPAIIYYLPDTDFFSDRNVNFYQNLLLKLDIDFIINHDASNDRSKFFLNTGIHSAKKISLYHQNPIYGINKLVSSSGRIRTFLFKKFPGIIRSIKVLRKKREIDQILKNSDRLILLSDEFKLQLAKDLKIKTSKIISISNPLISQSNQNSGIKKNQILFVGRMDSQKRPDLMLQIWSGIQDKFHDWELLFLGEGPDKNKIEEMSKAMQIKNVRFKGFVDPIPYYKEASIICMTSDYEGFGMVLIEAMQFGMVPIVFNNWASLKDIITDKVTGILVETENIDEYTYKLSQLIVDDELRFSISLNAKEFVKKFDIEKVGHQWIMLFQSLLTGK